MRDRGIPRHCRASRPVRNAHRPWPLRPVPTLPQIPLDAQQAHQQEEQDQVSQRVFLVSVRTSRLFGLLGLDARSARRVLPGPATCRRSSRPGSPARWRRRRRCPAPGPARRRGIAPRARPSTRRPWWPSPRSCSRRRAWVSRNEPVISSPPADQIHRLLGAVGQHDLGLELGVGDRARRRAIWAPTVNSTRWPGLNRRWRKLDPDVALDRWSFRASQRTIWRQNRLWAVS